jgi:hypothetical protein
MNKLLTALLACVFVSVSMGAVAAPDNPPPVHEQKNHVPDSTKNGNYLESQPDNNGSTGSTTGHDASGQKNSKASNIEHSKKVKEKPADGGVNVNQSQ